MAGLAYVDRRVRHVGFSKLRNLTAKDASALKQDEIWVVRKNYVPWVVLMPYNLYMKIQKMLPREED